MAAEGIGDEIPNLTGGTTNCGNSPVPQGYGFQFQILRRRHSNEHRLTVFAQTFNYRLSDCRVSREHFLPLRVTLDEQRPMVGLFGVVCFGNEVPGTVDSPIRDIPR